MILAHSHRVIAGIQTCERQCRKCDLCIKYENLDLFL